MPDDFIPVEGARQNNLKGQRRYVETFSPYARQFLERMDKPRADRIEGIPPAISIDQTNPVRTSRSTVGTMTELTDHLKLLFARAARLYCQGCGREVRRDTPESIAQELLTRAEDASAALIVFPVQIPQAFSTAELKTLLESQGYTRIHREEGGTLEVTQDRVRHVPENRGRIVEGLEAALAHGSGRVLIYPLPDRGVPDVPGVRPDHRRGLRAGGAGRDQDARRGSGPALADRVLPGMSGGSPAVCQEARGTQRRPLARSDCGPEALGAGGGGGLGGWRSNPAARPALQAGRHEPPRRGVRPAPRPRHPRCRMPARREDAGVFRAPAPPNPDG